MLPQTGEYFSNKLQILTLSDSDSYESSQLLLSDRTHGMNYGMIGRVGV